MKMLAERACPPLCGGIVRPRDAGEKVEIVPLEVIIRNVAAGYFTSVWACLRERC
ncbi:MAG: hypothetical protein ACLRZH_05415 [Ruthenibacterium lactatiformans]